MTSRTQIGVMGASLGTGNRGVSALGASLVGLIEEALPGAECFMLIGHNNDRPFELRTKAAIKRVPVVNYRMSPRAPLRFQLGWIMFAALLWRCLPVRALRNWLENYTPWIKNVVEARVVGDIRGGDSFSDIYGLKRFVIGSIPALSVLILKQKLVLFPQTYGPYKSRWAALLARFIVRRSSIILARDADSFRIATELSGNSSAVRFCPDVAFSLQPIAPKVVKVTPPLPAPASKVLVGLNVNGLMYRGGYTQKNMFDLKLDYPHFLIRLAETILSDPTRHLFLVPHTFAPPDRIESDPGACARLKQQLAPELQNRAHLLEGEYDQSEIKSVIGQCDFFIGSRMHACIAALSQGIPAVGVAYSKKFVGVFETVGVGDCVVDGRDQDAEQALRRTMEIFANRDAIRQRLEIKVAEAQNRLRATFKEAVAGKTTTQNHVVRDPQFSLAK